MSISGAAVVAQTASTAEAFKEGHVAFLRLRESADSSFSLVYCQGYDEHSQLLHLQWSKEAASAGPAPVRGQFVKCHAVIKGVLYTLTGTVTEVSGGPMPLIWMSAPNTCASVWLRTHMRYSVLSCLRLGEETDEHIYRMKHFEPMSLSMGGFGALVPLLTWPVGSPRFFAMKVLAEGADGAPVIELPSLELSGVAILRRVSKPTSEGLRWIGCAFDSLVGRGKTALECWLSAYMDKLREA